MQILQRAVERFPAAGGLWNNLGNLLAFQGDLNAAKEAYARSIRLDPVIASPHYNHSQLLRREFSFIEGGRVFQEARRIDPGRVDYFAYIHSLNANRFFMDEGPSRSSCWHYAFAAAGRGDPFAENLWALAGSGVPLDWAPWAFGGLAMAFLLLLGAGGGARRPVCCSGCGLVVCDKCHSGTAVTKMCTQCYQALYEGRVIPMERRSLQIRKMARHRSSRYRRLLLANVLFPGVGLSLCEERIHGMLYFLLFLFLALAGWGWRGILVSPVVVWEGGGAAVSLPILGGALLVYILAQVQFIRAIRAGR